jgi:transcriptional regulator with XRE-family HTH domain
MYLAENIQVVRKWLRDSQETFGARFNVVRSTVAKWEAGESQPPVEVLLTLQDLTGKTVAELVRTKITAGMLGNSDVVRDSGYGIYKKTEKLPLDVAALLEAVQSLRSLVESEQEIAAAARVENARLWKKVEFLEKKLALLDTEIVRQAGKKK